MGGLHQENDVRIHEIQTFLADKFVSYTNFFEFFLGNMLSNQSVKDTGTYLTLLVQDPETTLALKKLLAEYVGITTGKKLSLMLRAYRNVCSVIGSWRG